MKAFRERVENDLAQIVDSIENEQENPLEGYIMLKELYKTIDQCIKQIKDQVVDHIDKRCNKNEPYFGYMLDVRSNANYSFKHIPEWVELNNKLKELEKDAKAALKSSERNIAAVREDTGEILQMAKCTYGASAIYLTKSKEDEQALEN